MRPYQVIFDVLADQFYELFNWFTDASLGNGSGGYALRTFGSYGNTINPSYIAAFVRSQPRPQRLFLSISYSQLPQLQAQQYQDGFYPKKISSAGTYVADPAFLQVDVLFERGAPGTAIDSLRPLSTYDAYVPEVKANLLGRGAGSWGTICNIAAFPFGSAPSFLAIVSDPTLTPMRLEAFNLTKQTVDGNDWNAFGDDPMHRGMYQGWVRPEAIIPLGKVWSDYPPLMHTDYLTLWRGDVFAAWDPVLDPDTFNGGTAVFAPLTVNELKSLVKDPPDNPPWWPLHIGTTTFEETETLVSMVVAAPGLVDPLPRKIRSVSAVPAVHTMAAIPHWKTVFNEAYGDATAGTHLRQLQVDGPSNLTKGEHEEDRTSVTDAQPIVMDARLVSVGRRLTGSFEDQVGMPSPNELEGSLSLDQEENSYSSSAHWSQLPSGPLVAEDKIAQKFEGPHLPDSATNQSGTPVAATYNTKKSLLGTTTISPAVKPGQSNEFHIAMLELDDSIINTFKMTGARMVQVCACRNGKLVYAKSFTFAEDGYPGPSLQAGLMYGSCNKVLVMGGLLNVMAADADSEAAVKQNVLNMRLIDALQMQPVSNVDNFNVLTLGQLLGHRSNLSFDTAMMQRTLGPIENKAPGQYVLKPGDYKRYLESTHDEVFAGVPPGPRAYWNVGFDILGEVLSVQVTMQAGLFGQALRSALSSPQKIYAPTDLHYEDDAWSKLVANGDFHRQARNPTVLTDWQGTGALLPDYLGRSTEGFDAGGGSMVTSTLELARFAARLGAGNPFPLLNPFARSIIEELIFPDPVGFIGWDSVFNSTEGQGADAVNFLNLFKDGDWYGGSADIQVIRTAADVNGSNYAVAIAFNMDGAAFVDASKVLSYIYSLDQNGQLPDMDLFDVVG